MSTTSQQQNSWIPSDHIETIDISSLPTFDFSALTTQSISSMTIPSISTVTYQSTGATSYTIPSISALTTADIITLTGPGGGGSSGYTWSGSNNGSYSGTSYTFKMPEEWVDTFPNFERIKKMCEEYPGLKIAYDKFVTTYEMVKVDYDNPANKK